MDLGEGVEQDPYAHVDAVVVGLADHEPGHGQGEHAVESVDPDFWSVQWNMGEKDTTLGSLSCRKSFSAWDWER